MRAFPCCLIDAYFYLHFNISANTSFRSPLNLGATRPERSSEREPWQTWWLLFFSPLVLVWLVPSFDFCSLSPAFEFGLLTTISASCSSQQDEENTNILIWFNLKIKKLEIKQLRKKPNHFFSFNVTQKPSVPSFIKQSPRQHTTLIRFLHWWQQWLPFFPLVLKPEITCLFD